MANVIDFLMKNKNSDGTYSILHPITKTDNVKVTEEIPVMLNGNLGSFKNGDVVTAGTSIDDIVRKLLQVQIPPVYTEPTISLVVASGDKAGSYEEGAQINPNLNATFTKNDAGSITTLVIKKNDVEVASGTSNQLTHSESITVSGTINFTATATYAAGAIKKDNFGDDYSEGSIPSGSKTSSTIAYIGYRKYFYGADNVTTAAATSADVRALSSGSTNAASAGRTFNISVKKGQTRASFAYPATIRDVSSVKYVEFNNDESKDFFTKTTVMVEGANGYSAIEYKVYTYIPAQPFPSDMTFAVTL